MAVPGGMETEDFSDNDDGMCYNFSKYDNDECEKNKSLKEIPQSAVAHAIPLSQSAVPEISLTNGHVPKPPVISTSHNLSSRSAPIVGSVVVDDLRMATITGNLTVVEELLTNGLAVDTVLKSDWTGLMYACSCGHPSIVKLLLEKKADPNYQKDKFTPVLAVCASRQEKEEQLLECLQLLKESGAKANVWDRHHVTPLMYCARENRLKMLQNILSQNVEVDRQDNRGWTALFWAASCGHGQSIRFLLEGGADITKMATNGQTAAEVAYAQKHEEIGDILEKIRNHAEQRLEEIDKENLQKAKRGKRHVIQEAEKPSGKSFSVYGELEMFLSGLNLRDYISLFHEHRISFYDFLLLTEEDLEKMGIDKVGVRKNIMEGIKTIHLKKWEKSSLPNLKKQQQISCPDAVAMMANISSHLHYIKSSVRYLRSQIQKTPRILELGQEAANVHKLLEELSHCIRNERILCDELKFFNIYLEKIQDRSEFLPADLLVETVPDQRSTRKLSRVAIISITLIVGLLVWQKPPFLTKALVIPQKWHTLLS